MNVHDSERLTGLLEEAGYVAAPAGEQADVVVFNTCAVRENADNKLYGNLGHLAPVKAARPGHADRRRRLPGAEGPRHDHREGAVGRRRLRHPQHRLAAGAARARAGAGGGAGRDPRVARGLPVDAADPARVGVRRLGVDQRRVQQHLHVLHRPGLRGKEKDRRPGDILGRDRGAGRRGRHARSPCWGRTSTPTAWSSATGRRSPSCCAPAARSRGSSGCASPRPHPAEFTDDVIAAMAETPNVMPQLHMPLQSGSDRVLKAMRRSYRRAKYLGIIERVRAAMPDAAITTDIIVGFPGETEDDFAQTLDVVREARFAAAFTFQYSIRPGTPAATHARPGPAGGRAGALRAAGRGRQRDRLGGEPGARSAAASSSWSPRARAARTPRRTGSPVAPATTGSCTSRRPRRVEIRPGDVVDVEITYAAPHHLVADGPVLAAPPYPLRRRLGGPHRCPRLRRRSVGLGMPTSAPPPDPPSRRKETPK